MKPKGSFEAYCDVMGGILQCAGIGGFLDSLEDFYEESDLEGANLRMFVDAWFKDFRLQVVGTSELFELINKYDLPIDLGNKTDKGQRTRLGMILTSLRDRQFGEYRIAAAGTRKHAKLWQLVCVDPPVVNGNQNQPEVHQGFNEDVHQSNLLNKLDNNHIGEPSEPLNDFTSEKIFINEMKNLSVKNLKVPLNIKRV